MTYEKKTEEDQKSQGNSSKSTSSAKVPCSNCNGTGKVKYYYGDSALEAFLAGKDDYEYGICTACNGTGYSGFTQTTQSGKTTCPSCGNAVSKLITKADAAGENRTWCSKCWSDYNAIIGN